MTDRPVIFSAPMIRALLAGTKTMTRRLAWRLPPKSSRTIFSKPTWQSPWQKVMAGDRLWVRENYYRTDDGDCETAVYATDRQEVAHHINAVELLAAGHHLSDEWKLPHLKLRPSIHMPRWASRLTLEVTATKIERLQDIGWNDAIAEGLTRGDPLPEVPNSHGTIWHDGVTNPLDGWTRDPTAAFRSLWETIHGEGAWAVNPELVCLTFTVHKTNIDQRAKDAA